MTEKVAASLTDSRDNFVPVMIFNEDTSRWTKVRVPRPQPGQKPDEAAVRAELEKRGLELTRVIDIQPKVDYICMTETLEERSERLKKRRRRLLERELDIDLAGWRK
jgi:hypothetical protein